MNSFRLIIDPPLNSAVNMAKDHAILHGLSLKGSLPTLRFFRWDKPSVTIGYFQKIYETVNTRYCKKNGISVTRRETGGGTVLHHRELTYSFTIPVKSGIVPQSVEGSFREILKPFIKALDDYGISAEYRPINDIVISNRKISGSAQVRKRGILQQHGTLILDYDSEIISAALARDEEKLKKRGFHTTAEAVTSVSRETGAVIDEKFIDDIIVKLVTEFAKRFRIDFAIGNLNETEYAIMESFSKKFLSDEWNFKR